MTGLTCLCLLVPVLRGSAFGVRHTAPVVVHPQAFLTRRAGPRGRAGAAGLLTVFADLSLFFQVSSFWTLI